MVKKPEYLRFENSILHTSRKTRVLNVISISSKKQLGQIRWYARWRQYVFHPNALTIWNSNCLDQIEQELGKLNREHREMLRENRLRALHESN
jgi:hypothetical protein